jgi:hypothetical protein
MSIVLTFGMSIGTSTDLELQWLTTLAARAGRFRAKVPT